MREILCVSLFLMLYPDLNKNSCMCYDCKTHLIKILKIIIKSVLLTSKDKINRQVGDYDRIRFERRKDIFK